MAGMDGWEIALVAAAAFIAVTSLVRLMRHQRNKVTIQWRKKVEEEKQRQIHDADGKRQMAEKAMRGESTRS